MAMALNLLKALVLLLEAPAARQDALANWLKPTKHIRPNRRRRFYLVLAVLVDWPRDRWATPCRTARRPVKARAARAGRPAPEDPTTWTVTDDWPEDLPVTEAEVFEAWLGDLFDEFFSTRH
jgi:hypothetical protein